MKQGLGVLLLSLDGMVVYRRVNSNMTSSLSGHISIFGSVFFVLKFLLGITRQWSRKKLAILTLKPRSHVMERGLLLCKVFLVKYTHQYNYIRVAERQIGKSYT